MRRVEIRRFGIVAGAVGLALTALAAGSFSVGAAQAPPTTYQETVIGTDFHALDHRQSTQYVPSTGGGVYLYGVTDNGTNYMETNVDLPVGARIKRVVILYRDCGADVAEGTWYLGSYSPSGGFQYEAPTKSISTCAFGQLSIVPSGVVRVLSTRRYVVGMGTSLNLAGVINPHPILMVRGARIVYTCPTKCLP